MQNHYLDDIRSLLEIISEKLDHINQPILEEVKGIRGDPIRHPYMSAIVWYLANSINRDNLKILEIGSYVGSSLFTWIEALKKYDWKF